MYTTFEQRKNYVIAENPDQAAKILSRLRKSSYHTKGELTDDDLHILSYPCKFYTNNDREIILDYTPFAGRPFSEFVRSWVER